MAVITFPASPANGATYAVNGVVYTYSTAKTYWYISSAPAVAAAFDLGVL